MEEWGSHSIVSSECGAILIMMMTMMMTNSPVQEVLPTDYCGVLFALSYKGVLWDSAGCIFCKGAVLEDMLRLGFLNNAVYTTVFDPQC